MELYECLQMGTAGLVGFLTVTIAALLEFHLKSSLR